MLDMTAHKFTLKKSTNARSDYKMTLFSARTIGRRKGIQYYYESLIYASLTKGGQNMEMDGEESYASDCRNT